ncbi:UNVERIFIED_CONTAM: hypothetical protein Slati_4606000 [Sesamum latifolium]|uniref:Uncharacterized protein n=1 Tax=Sesamum latifolium TaxID=2727402 RepID=A0AAW2S2S3_9LAMI
MGSKIESVTCQYVTVESPMRSEMVRALRVCGHSDCLSREWFLRQSIEQMHLELSSIVSSPGWEQMPNSMP